MKKILLLLAFFALAPEVYAKTTTTVKVNNDVSISDNNTSTVKNDITIETNGKVTHYSSDKSENIEISSVDGVSEIKVNGENVSPTPAKEPGNNEKKDKQETNAKNLLERLEEIVKKLFFFWN